MFTKARIFQHSRCRRAQRFCQKQQHRACTNHSRQYQSIMQAQEVVIQLQNDLGRYLARTTLVVISLVPPYVTMCKVYCQVTLL